jgi:hypothetical protein
MRAWRLACSLARRRRVLAGSILLLAQGAPSSYPLVAGNVSLKLTVLLPEAKLADEC